MAINVSTRSGRKPNRSTAVLAAIPKSSPVKHNGIASIMGFMSQNYFRPIKVQDFAGLAGLSRRGFYKAFRRDVGKSPAYFLRSLRIEQAKRLLLTGDFTLHQIATSCGYRSTNSFWVAFRRVTGVAPKHFQKGSAPSPLLPESRFGRLEIG